MMNFSELDIWTRSRVPANRIYNITKSFPEDEMFGLTNQMRRTLARGSVFELEAQLYTASDQKYFEENVLGASLGQVTTCKRVVSGFVNNYKTRATKKETRNTNNER